jgi:predicted DNA-binding protein
MTQSKITKKNTSTFNFWLPSTLKKELTDRASATGENPSAIVREALKTYLQAS